MNYYEHWCIQREAVTQEEQAWWRTAWRAMKLVQQPRNEWGDHVPPDVLALIELCDLKEYEEYGVSAGNIVIREDQVYITDDNGQSTLDACAAFLQAFLRANDPKGLFAFEWCCTADKPRVGAYGGGACVVTATDRVYMSTATVLDQLRSCTVPYVERPVIPVRPMVEPW